MDFDNHNFNEKEEVFYSDDIVQKKEKNIRKLKLKIFFKKLLLSPTLLLNFIKKSLFSLVKLRGVIGVVLIILFLYLTDSFVVLYYKYSISSQTRKIESIQESIKLKDISLLEANKNLNCYKNQFTRIAENKKIEIWFCNKK